ncbi:MAG: hypothetical protein AAF196_14010 [Planctomycetota bacterium]
MQQSPEPEPSPSDNEDRAYSLRLAARLAGRPERRVQVVALARARMDRSSTESFHDSLARDLAARLGRTERS